MTQLPYEVRIRYDRGSDKLIAKFDSRRDAEMFIREKLADDVRTKVKASYRLGDGHDFEDFTPGNAGVASAQTQSSQQRSSTQSFSPTPMPTAPKPPGIPTSWSNKDEGEKKK